MIPFDRNSQALADCCLIALKRAGYSVQMTGLPNAMVRVICVKAAPRNPRAVEEHPYITTAGFSHADALYRACRMVGITPETST